MAWARRAGWLPAGAAAAAILLLFTLAGIRLFYPYELEWIEGANVDQVRWIAEGRPLYGPPRLDFIPLVYNPLYFALSAGLSLVTGGGFLAPRLLSILATAGCLGFLYTLTIEETGSRPAGLVAAGLYAAAYRFAGAWMDLAKTDSLFLCLLLAGFYAGRRPGWPGQALSGLLYILAYYTKQLALPMLVLLAATSLAETRGRSWRTWLWTAAGGLAVFWVLEASSGGWYSFYSLRAVSYHARDPDIWFYWRALFGAWWPTLLAAGASGAVAWTARRGSRPAPSRSAMALAAALILGGWSVFFKVWTYSNGFMPACAGLALLAGLGYGPAVRRAQSAPLWAGSLALLLLGQFAALAYSPLKQLPTDQDRAAAAQFVAFVRALPGEVLVFNHGYVNHLAGKATYLHSVPLGDITGGAYPPRSEADRLRIEQTRRNFRQAVEQQVFDWIVLDRPRASWLPYYLYADNLFDDPAVLYPVTGARARPESLMIKNPVARGGPLPLADSAYDFLFAQGWGPAQAWGRWTDGPRAEVQVSLEEGRDYLLRIEASAACPAEGSGTALRAGWDETVLGAHQFSGCERKELEFALPAAAVSEDGNTLWFALGGGALAFTSIVFIQQSGNSGIMPR